MLQTDLIASGRSCDAQSMKFLYPVARFPLTRRPLPVQPGGEELTDALGALSLEPGMHHGLRGLPTPAGKHIR